ncbi:maltokinase N-terminal cap-like domain-containing protein [Homoserinibacter sp. YIM 151385]|uniref:maltokinase N-terminal cap-like domain-containing protein n=1 Tax=Homoserinibacter sp. YIM 151385 TaxID=2985506 RepID=UPI0022F13165|nr:aminoglycoside phosphotransferase [Homoserinibacter sp. YIM 151385]WBU38375.1 aminoglycoside phosphotransferase [Homoserinibacter sp. YIM 151385]
MQTTLGVIADWMAYQRWYGGKGRRPRLTSIAEILMVSADPAARARTMLLRDDADPRGPIYQVPIVERDTIPRGAGPRFIGRGLGGAYLFDGPHDPAFPAALLGLMQSQGRLDAGLSPTSIGASRVLDAEQSNTSIIIEVDDSAPIIAKVFRVVQPGDNPEVTVQSALSEAGMPFIPRFLGGLAGEWNDARGLREHGHLAAVQEFVAGAVDGWSAALASARAGEDFRVEARALGEATASMHRALAERLETRSATAGDTVALAAGWHGRLAEAIQHAPQLAALREDAGRLYDRAQHAPWPRLQRVHGDLHLGQVLRAADGSWRFIDFEGEPLRPLEERARPDTALRDIAGMLRSFDYAAGFSGDQDGRWAQGAREAYLAGLRDAGVDLEQNGELLAALELDKALYEVAYEARNRPDWIGIPLAGAERLIAAERTHRR